MRTTVTSVAIVALLSSDASILWACGDKFFIVGQRDRFSRVYASLHPGDILVYTASEAPAAALLRDSRLHKHLARAGHRVMIADDAGGFNRALRARRVDIVLTHVDDTREITTTLAALHLTPAVLPLTADGDSVSADAHHASTIRLRATDNVKRLLAGIEGVMKARAAAGVRPPRT